MERLKLKTNTDTANTQIQTCKTAKENGQKIYDAFSAVGCTIKLSNVMQLLTVGDKNDSEISNTVKTLFIENIPEPPKIFGLTISPEKLRDMIEIPNISEIVEILKNSYLGATRVEKMLTLENGTIDTIEDFEGAILELHTEYADTPKQIKKAEILIKTRDNLNEYLEEFQQYEILPNLRGLTPWGKKYEIDISEIKAN